ncbi:uncharacterized protein [Venturia canescens]|uniref:uncharacterized protein n=1 Tax=Venturia canescens TaxID=32260 RepID=UPI001C9CE2FB|nr:uncharacterized protein LOC122413166 [Venturia canescens]
MLKKCYFVFCYFVIFLPLVPGFSKRIKLGSLFEEDDPRQQAFLLSVNAVNTLRHTDEELANFYLVADTNTVVNDAFEVSEHVCTLLGKGVVAIFGPFDKNAAEHVQSICDTVDMPNIVARLDVDPGRMQYFNFYPHADGLAMVLLGLVTEYEWKSYTVLYDNYDGLVRSNELLKRWNPKGYPVTIRHLGSGPDFRDVLLEVKHSTDVNIVFDCSNEILNDVLVQAQQVGILSDRHQIIVSNLDLHNLDLEPYQYSGVNFTGMRLVDIENEDCEGTFNDYLSEMKLESLSQLSTEAALIYDSVQFFARAFKRATDALDGDIKKMTCDNLETWEFGASLSNYLRTTEMHGLTGLLKFQTNGLRSDFKLDIYQLTPDGPKTTGIYNSSTGISWRVSENAVAAVEDDDMSNKTFRILIALNPPYNMLKESSAMKVGNDRYEGYAIEIIHELSKLLHFNYTFIETDPDYGSKRKDGTWSGMLGAIIAGEADLAITDLTITAERESAVDFTMPFLNLGISILYKKPKKAPPNLFSFLSPFSNQVWLYLSLAYMFCSLLLFVIGRMCPSEWDNPYPCIEEPEQLENQFTLKNSFWFTIGAIMQQGSEIAPIGMSTRIFAASWWFFCLIIVSSYTANLAAFLVVETPVKTIKSAEDLADLDGEIQYGAKKGGSTFNFFKGSNYSTYAKMYKYMEEHADEVLPDSNELGKNWVLDPDKKYAFLSESSSIQYIEQRECDLTQVGGLLDAKGYGIAMRKNYKYRNRFNTATLHLQETGALTQIQKKWWEEKRGGGKCKEEGGSAAASELTLNHVGGVFLVLGIGVALSVPFSLWELVFEVGLIAYKEKLSFKKEFMDEMKFVMKCKGSVKPARQRKSSSHGTEASTEGGTPPYGPVPTVITTAAKDELVTFQDNCIRIVLARKSSKREMRKKNWFTLLWFVTSVTSVRAFVKNIKLGLLCEKNDTLRTAFSAAVKLHNQSRGNNNCLAQLYFHEELYDIEDDLFATHDAACKLFDSGVAAIFGPSGKKSAHVQNMCDGADIPNIVVHPELEPMRNRAFNFFPQTEILGKLFANVITEFQWKAFTILYESSDSLVGIDALLKRGNPKSHTVAIRHLGAGRDFRKVLLDVKKTKVENLVIDCSYNILELVLRQCQQVGLMSDGHSIMVTNLDLHTIDLEPYQYSGVNLTGFRLIDLEYAAPGLNFERFLYDVRVNDIGQLRVPSALMYDAVILFSTALQRALKFRNGEAQKLKCNGSDYWDFGTVLNNYIRTTEIRGVTGVVKLSHNGLREDFKLDVVNLQRDGLQTMAYFNSTQQFIDWEPNERLKALAEKDDLHNKTFRVLIALVDPYNMLTKSALPQSGNDRYEGFAIDIIHEISKILNFNYTFIECQDYGDVDNVTKRATGMIGKLVRGEADLAITDFTITSKRENLVDFTMPFMNLGISILYRKPTKAAPSLFSFLSPFSNNVWLYLMVAYVVCSFLLFIIGRMSPKEWTNPYPCIGEPEQLYNQFTLKNSFWFMAGALMQQGSEIAPIGISTRTLASSWWFFTLLIISSYTANLAAFLVVETNVKIIRSAQDLANMNGAIKYGAKKNGATWEFFSNNDSPMYAKMHEYMQNNPDVMTSSNNEGVSRALDNNQNYAFLMESSSIEYITQRKCNLTQIGDLLDNKGYGIAMPKNAEYRKKFSDAVLHLSEKGVLRKLKTKWWEQKNNGGACDGDQSASASKLTLDHVGGVFLVLGLGVAFSMIFALWEFAWHICCTSYKENLSFKDVLIEESRSIIKAKSSVKSARRRTQSLEIMDSSTRASTPAFGFGPTVVMTPSDDE